MYVDKLGLYHDSKDARSNNKWIYTAYAKRVGLIQDISKEAYAEALYCFAWKARHKEREAPPISRDEILGLVYLLKPEDTISLSRKFNFSPYPLPRLNIFRLICELILSYGEHRNYHWQNDLKQMRHVAYMVPFQDRAFLMRHWEMKVPWYYKFIEWIDKKIKKTNRSSLAIRSFKYNMDDFKGICYYFEVGHPIRDYITKKWVL